VPLNKLSEPGLNELVSTETEIYLIPTRQYENEIIGSPYQPMEVRTNRRGVWRFADTPYRCRRGRRFPNLAGAKFPKPL